MSLFISINSPSKELEKCPIDEAITILAANAAIEKRNGHLPKGPALDITFMLPNNNDIPPFNGMRMGGYTTENKTLYFESAVPEHIVRSKHAPRYVAIALQDVVDNASDFFKSHNIAFDEVQWHRAIAPLVRTASVLSKSN
ncbi:hypothetical protein [Kaarinaea lacus]